LIRTVAADNAVVAATANVQAVAAVVGTTRSGGPDGVLTTTLATLDRPMTVYLPDGRRFGVAVDATPAVRVAGRDGSSFTVDVDGDREIVVAVLGLSYGSGTAVVRTVVPHEDLVRGVTAAWAGLAGLGLVLVLLGLFVADRLARALTRPIAELSTVSHRLANADLTARARPAGPRELRDVAGALNHLAGRIEDLLQRERDRAADLSHRLRTPLTALRLDAEALPADPARVTAGVDALERAVDAVIRQSRDDAHRRPAGTCDAVAVVRDRLAFWAVLAEDTDRALEASLPDSALRVAIGADDLAAALDALLGNVFAHTDDGVGFAVALRPRPGGGAVLTVTDAGPGFPAPDAALTRGASGSGSTGLGLDIVRRAAEATGGTLSLGAAPGGGARVTVELGGPATLARS